MQCTYKGIDAVGKRHPTCFSCDEIGCDYETKGSNCERIRMATLTGNPEQEDKNVRPS